ILFGNPHAYDMESRRGQLTMRLQDHAFSVILLDEFEKAHAEVFQRFLQLFDEGLLINGASETINLRNSIFILTSNFGASMMAGGRVGFGPTVSLEDRERQIREEMVRFFTPEFINRIDSVSLFKPLTKPVLREIAYRRVQEVLQREGLLRRDLIVEVDEDVVEWLVDNGYSERYGARYLARQVEKAITYPLAQQIIQNSPPSGSVVRLFTHNGRVASALILPSTTDPDEEPLPTEGVLESADLPRRLTWHHLENAYPQLEERVHALERTEFFQGIRERLNSLTHEMSSTAFWDNLEDLKPRLEQMGYLSSYSEQIDSLRRNLNELSLYINERSDDDPEARAEAALRFRYLLRDLPRAEISQQFSHPWHAYGVFLQIEARGRRTVARHWTEILANAYLQWAEERGFEALVIGEELGSGTLQAAWIKISGYGAYGLLHTEVGNHRLIRSGEGNGRRGRQVIQSRVAVWPASPAFNSADYDGGLDIDSTTIESDGRLSALLQTQFIVRGPDGDTIIRINSPLASKELRNPARQIAGMIRREASGTLGAPHPIAADVVARSYGDVTSDHDEAEDELGRFVIAALEDNETLESEVSD
ncbi:MAG: AAA domain-containing protein, partial [Chloroflexi bacterium]|nr:AAA domain-containing protein [Chloroflexota bacterium]